MTNLIGELGGLTMQVSQSPYELVGDAYVSDGLLYSSESGVVVKAMGPYSITVHGYIAMTGVTFSSGLAVPSRCDWRGIIMEYKDQSVFYGNRIAHALVAVEVIGYGSRGGVRDNDIFSTEIGLFVCGLEELHMHSTNRIRQCGSGMFVDYRGF